VDVPSLGGRLGVAVGDGVFVGVGVGVGDVVAVGLTAGVGVLVAEAAPVGVALGVAVEPSVLGRGVNVGAGVGVRVPATVPVTVGFEAAATDGDAITVGLVLPPGLSWTPRTWLEGVAESNSSIVAPPCWSWARSWGRREAADWPGGGVATPSRGTPMHADVARATAPTAPIPSLTRMREGKRTVIAGGYGGRRACPIGQTPQSSGEVP